MIRFHTIDVALPDFDPEAIRQWIVSVIQDCGFSVGELHY